MKVGTSHPKRTLRKPVRPDELRCVPDDQGNVDHHWHVQPKAIQPGLRCCWCDRFETIEQYLRWRPTDFAEGLFQLKLSSWLLLAALVRRRRR
jgi:hypothetical protein